MSAAALLSNQCSTNQLQFDSCLTSYANQLTFSLTCGDIVNTGLNDNTFVYIVNTLITFL